MCEDLEDEESLAALYNIFKQGAVCLLWQPPLPPRHLHRQLVTAALQSACPANLPFGHGLEQFPNPYPPCSRRAVVLLNDTGLFDVLFDDAHVMDFMGALEYEPGAYRLPWLAPATRAGEPSAGNRTACPPHACGAEIKPENRPKHRQFLRDQVGKGLPPPVQFSLPAGSV